MQYLYLAITIIGVTYATTTSTTDVNQAETCDSCCQGPSGLPGFPGEYGLPGRDGLKGERGDAGQRGDEGVRGLQGDAGLDGLDGPAGPIGPSGIDGGKGDQGLTGGKGQKGEVGQKGESGERVANSAFTAVKISYQTGNRGDVLTFDVTETNYGGHFSTGTSKFTCQIPGVYWFTVTMCKNGAYNVYVNLVKDDTPIVQAYSYDSDSVLTQSTHGAVLQLAAGEQVWVEFVSNGQTVYSDSNKLTTFSGFLLFET